MIHFNFVQNIFENKGMYLKIPDDVKMKQI